MSNPESPSSTPSQPGEDQPVVLPETPAAPQDEPQDSPADPASQQAQDQSHPEPESQAAPHSQSAEGPSSQAPAQDASASQQAMTSQQTTTQPPHPQPPAAAQPFPQPLAKPQGGLSTFLKVSIILLAALSIAAIALVFVGDFEGKVERITGTFIIFAIFVGLTAADTSRGNRNSWYAPVALIANSYILALLLIITWMSEGDYFLAWNLFWKSILVIGVTRAVVGCCQLLLGMGEGKPEPLSRFAFVTSVLAVLSGILFTAPLAIEVFDVTVPELYWKIAVATLLLTALGLAISLLLRWSYGSQDREAARRTRAEQALAARQAGAYTGAAPIGPGAPAPAGQQAGGYVAAAPVAPAAPAQPAPQSQQTFPQDPAAQPQQVPPSPQPGSQAAPLQPGQQTVGGQPLLPWPTFADGRPLPMLPDGQPDFSVPGAPLPPQ